MKKVHILEAVLLILVMAMISAWLYALITYGGKPITEIPSWAIPFIVGGGKR